MLIMLIIELLLLLLKLVKGYRLVGNGFGYSVVIIFLNEINLKLS